MKERGNIIKENKEKGKEQEKVGKGEGGEQRKHTPQRHKGMWQQH